jgi:type VI secretion system protein ImpL
VWLWFVLAALVVLIAWALWWVLGLGTAYPVIATVVVVVGLATIFLVKWLLARRAAGKLESALAAQASQQAMNARPERRAEIQELQKQLTAGIGALKTSKLGRGGQRGAAALYSMPWYMIIGPPGAGKTTALKHSGMVFPYGGGQGGGVRGVGGTRNCDWWFTNEAILLDTAGRYTTESDDRDEWISFLQFLVKYRQKRPINGIIIAISISEVLDANEQQVEAIGKKLRARTDEVMTQLKMVVPVYILFTKIDLIAGFSEFFGDLKKSDRAQAWGSTLKLDLPKNEPGKIFDAEFDVLVQRLHARALKRCAMERSREAREKLYQFPIEFAGMKKNLSDLIAVAFQPNAFQGTPILRGFYFTSGTQEGKPMDRVLARMSQAMGIRTGDPQQQQQQQANVESKSYFLHDVFMNIIFPDGDIAVRSQSEVRRQALMRVAISGASLLLASILAIPAASSYLKNKDFLQESERRAKITASLDWSDGKPASQKFPPLKPTLDQLKELDKHEADGVPWGMGWMMYSADRVKRPLLAVYVSQMQAGFVVPCKTKIEERLKTANGDRYLRDRNTLKLYLMINDVENLDVEWATGRYTQLWVEVLKPSSDISDSELKELARPHVQYYFDLLKAGKVTPLGLDKDLVERVRHALQNVPIQQRYYDLFVNSLNEERIEESGDPTIDNMVFPPIQLPRLFPDRQEVLTYFRSQRFDTTKTYQQVDGPYTDKGHAAVVKQIEAAEGLIKAESWVVPMTPEETPAKIPEYVKGVAKQYESEYMRQWMDFFTDIKVKTPTTADEAIDLYRIQSTTEYPLRRLLQALEDHTQWKSVNPLEGNDAIAREANRRFNQKLNMYTHGIILNVDLRDAGKKLQVIPEKFKSACSFAAAGKGDSRVFKYAEIVKRLREQIIEAKNQDPTLDLRKMNDQLDAARKSSEQLLSGLDDTANGLLRPLLLDGLNVGVRPTLGNGVDINKVGPGGQPPKGGPTPPSTWKMPTVPGR